MPNYVRNIVTPKNPEAFFKVAINDSEEMDFNKVISMPYSLNIVSPVLWRDESSFSNDDILKFQNEMLDPLFKRILIQINDDAINFANKTVEILTTLNLIDEIKTKYHLTNYPDSDNKVRELILSYFNIHKYGHSDWYGWSCANWGTKWNACNSFYDGVVIEFDTAWSAPIPIYKELAKQFDFKVVFADEDYGNNCGYCIAENGELKVSYLEGSTQEFSLAFAHMVWDGMDYSYEYEEEEGYTIPSSDTIAEASKLFYSLS